MKASQDKCKKSEKGVSFGAIETKETRDRHSSSIEQLTSPVNKLDMKLDRQESQYRLQSIRIEEEDACKDKVTMGIETGPIVKIGINAIGIEETFNTITEVTGPTIGTEVDQGIMGIKINYRETNNSQNYRRNNYRQDYGNQSYRNRDRSLSQDHGGQGRDIEAIPGIIIEIGHTIEVKVEIEKERVEAEIDPVVERKDKG